MLAHTSFRDLLLTTQFVIGVVLLSAAYLSHDHSFMAGEQLKVNSEQQLNIEKDSKNQKRC